MKITFLGGVGTVTGSKYLLEAGGTRLMVDCGLFQGLKQLRRRNWMPLPVTPGKIDAVVLTHAHLDHSGYLPLFVKSGFRGHVYCTEATRDLCGLLLPDSGHLQEKDADFANRHKFSRHKPALPLYTRRDAEQSLKSLVGVPFYRKIQIGNFEVRFLSAGHILGSSIVEITNNAGKIVFSGDLGRPGSAIMPDPDVLTKTDYLVIESTYGDRQHDNIDAERVLADLINETVGRGGTVLIPSFAVGRAQALLFHLWQLRQDSRIPDLPIFLDSPMAINASEIFSRHLANSRLSAVEWCAACNVATYVRHAEESRALDAAPMPKVIISASGMATGGRILHHLKRYAPDRRSTILFTGFQAAGTRGQSMVAGARCVRIHGHDVPVAAHVKLLETLSAHADANEIMAWLGNMREPPKRTFVTHGELIASDRLRFRIQDELGWKSEVPEYRDEVELT